MPSEGEWNEVLGLSEDSDAAYDGALTLLTHGCTYDVLLMVTGPERGRIVHVDWNMQQAPYYSQFPDFLTWYATWLAETLAGNDMTWFGYGLPLNQPDSVAVATNAREPRHRREAALNNLRRTRALKAELLGPLREALLAETDMGVATNLLTILAATGRDDLAGIGWSLLKRARGRLVLQVVQAMKTAGLAAWSEAAHWALEQDADRESGEGLLFMLQRENALSRRAIELAFASQHVAAIGLYVNHTFSDPLPVPDAFLIHPDPAVRRHAAEYQPAEALRPHLPRMLELFRNESSDHVRQGWALVLGRFEDPFVTTALIDFLAREESSIVRSALTGRLGERKAKDAVPLLMTLTRDEDRVLHLEAARALGEIGDERARPALEALLDQDEVPFRFDGRGGEGYGYSVA